MKCVNQFGALLIQNILLSGRSDSLIWKFSYTDGWLGNRDVHIHVNDAPMYCINLEFQIHV